MPSKKAEATQVISDLLAKEHSRANSELILAYIGRDVKKVEALIDIICTDTRKLHQRGAYVMWIMRHEHLDLLRPHLPRLLSLMPRPAHVAFSRALISILSEMYIPEELLGEVADLCFGLLDDPRETVAVRAHAMSTLLNICRREPELANELKMIIEEHYDQGTAGFKTRGRKVLRELEKISKNTQT